MNIIYKISVLSIIIFFGLSCNKSNDPEPEKVAPVMTGIEISGENKTYSVVITFNEGVYSTSDKSGDLTRDSFRLTFDDELISSDSYLVNHSASQKKATIVITFDFVPDNDDKITVAPKNGYSIYNFEGIAMTSTEKMSIAIDGTSHETIIIKDTGEGTGTTSWTSNNVYILDGFVFVNEGHTLTIEPGTLIKGKGGQGENASALIVARGGLLIAEGTADNPIIFTAEADDLDGSLSDFDDGLWGGVIMLGHATLNTVPGEQQIEGIPETESRGIYGGTDDNDNSGILKYVSIRHGGTDIGEGNEINGLTLGGVGSQTTIEFVEVFANRDDGFEIFGGAARLKNVISAFCGDDAFDYDQGYHGTGQFWIGIQGYDRGDRLGEHDGGTDPETGSPIAKPYIYNVTYFGRGVDAGKRTITFRDNAGGHYANSIFYNQKYGIDVEMLVGDCSFNRFENGDLTIMNNIIYYVDDPTFFVSAASDVPDENVVIANDSLSAYFLYAGNKIYDPGFSIRATKYNITPSNDVSNNLAELPSDPWFLEVNFKGAVDPEQDSWFKGWSLFSKYSEN